VAGKGETLIPSDLPELVTPADPIAVPAGSTVRGGLADDHDDERMSRRIHASRALSTVDGRTVVVGEDG
jgi:hypothetical protein